MGWQFAPAFPSSGSGTTGVVIQGSEPTFDGAVDTQVFPIGLTVPEDFQGYADTAAMKAAYITHESHGSLSLVTTWDGGGAKACQCTFNADGCLSGTDADVGIEKGNLTDFTSAHRDYYCTMSVEFDSNFVFYAPACAGATDLKTIIFFREENNTGVGRITFHSHKPSSGDYNPNPYNLSDFSRPYWRFAIAPTATSQQPGGNKTASYIQNVQNALYPDTLKDGLPHRLTFFYRKESVEDAGDGALKLWVDATAVLDYDGGDPNNTAFGVVYTRATGIGKTLQMLGILNRDMGLTSPTTCRIKNIQVWYRTAS